MPNGMWEVDAPKKRAKSKCTVCERDIVAPDIRFQWVPLGHASSVKKFFHLVCAIKAGKRLDVAKVCRASVRKCLGLNASQRAELESVFKAAETSVLDVMSSEKASSPAAAKIVDVTEKKNVTRETSLKVTGSAAKAKVTPESSTKRARSSEASVKRAVSSEKVTREATVKKAEDMEVSRSAEVKRKAAMKPVILPTHARKPLVMKATLKTTTKLPLTRHGKKIGAPKKKDEVALTRHGKKIGAPTKVKHVTKKR